MSLPRVIAICGDPGGAEAVAPVLAALRTEKHADVCALAYSHARAVWATHGLQFDELDERIDVARAGSLLDKLGAELLFTGTSCNGVDLERPFIAAARARGLPSVAILDFWSNYRARFADDTGALIYLPDRIAVMDTWARDEMIAAEFPADRLVVTGQPAFDALAEWRCHAIPATRAATRARLGVEQDEQLILFASQPLATVYGGTVGIQRALGYTEHTVIDLLITALARIGTRHARRITLVLRPHPREDIAILTKQYCTTTEALRVMVSGEGDRRAAVLAADLVVGMTSVLLVEACLLGCLTVSLQPGLCTDDTLPTNHTGWSQAVYTAATVEPAIERLLYNTDARARMSALLADAIAAPGATQRVVRLLEAMLVSEDRHNVGG